jgi:AraC-like DNA-binding protein
MDNFCIWLNRLVRWLDRSPLPPIPFVGQAFHACDNAPAPHVEIVFMTHGGFGSFQVGGVKKEFPPNHVSLHNVHFGNHAPLNPQAAGWCLFFDIAKVDALQAFAQRPIFCLMPIAHPERLAAAFEAVTIRSRMHRSVVPHYRHGPWAYVPPRRGADDKTLTIYLKAAILELLAVLKDEAEGIGLGIQEAQSRPVREAITFMAVNHGNPDLRLDDIARAAGLSMDHFGRVFQAQVGLTPMEHLRSIRIDQSCSLLSHTKSRVREIAFEVGFRDPLHFSRVFRARTGMSPLAYRLHHAG